MKSIPYLLLLLLCVNANAENNLWLPNEKVIFSCKIKEKLVSICFKKSDNGVNKGVSYRYGKNPANIELAYPQANQTPDFKIYSSESAKTGLAVIGFKISKYNYSVFHTRSAFGFNGSGMIVRKNESILQTTICEESSVDADYLFYHVKTLGQWSDNLDYLGPES